VIFSPVDVKCFILARLLFTPVISAGPVINAKFLSIMSKTMHFLPASFPEFLIHMSPVFIPFIFKHLQMSSLS
jgi:hypothetical protein